jgi:hypothetical protein
MRVANIATDVAILPTDATGPALLFSSCRMVRLLEITAMSFVQLELEALKILTALEDMNTDKATTALAAAHALAYALADAAEAGDRAAKLAA